MKVYWSNRLGCVICSANASRSGLGGSNQKEAGVYLPPNVVDIKRLWNYAKPKPIQKGDLKRLARESDRASRQRANGSKEPPPDFLEWYNQLGPSDWKLGYWEEAAPFAKSAVKTAKERFGVMQPHQMLTVKQGQAKPFEWHLTFKLPGGTSLDWLYVDFIIKVDRSDKAAFYKEHPYQAVQANSPVEYPPPPFKLDKAFRTAFKQAIVTYGQERIKTIDTVRPPKAVTAGEPDYEVGYRNPPKATRFRPGRSGNPWGRPKGSRNSGTLLQRALDETVAVPDGGTERRMSKRELFYKTLVARSLTEPQYAALLLKTMERHDLITADDPVHRIEVSFVKPQRNEGTDS